jgi:signal transduction histidine kinase
LAALAALLLSCWPPGAADAANDILWLTPHQDRFSLASYLQVMEDPTGLLAVGDVSSPENAHRFRPLPNGVLRPGWGNSTFWLRLTLASREPSEGQPRYFFDLAQSNIVAATLFTPRAQADDRPAWQEVGPLDRHERPQHLRSQFSHFPLPALSERPQTIFVRVRSYLAMEALPEFVTRTGFLDRVLAHHLLAGALLGILLLLALTNLANYFFLRAAVYLWYALLLISSLLFLALSNGLLQDLAPQVQLFHLTGISGSMFGLAFIVRYLFVRSFLPLKQLFPVGDRVAMALTICAAPVVVILLAGYEVLPWLKIYVVLGMTRIPIFLWVGYRCWRGGFAPARLYFLANLPQSLSMLYFLADSVGLAPPIPISIYYVQEAGIVCEAILLALALAQRVKVLRQERERIEQAAQRESRENQERLRGLVGELVRGEERQRRALADDLHDSISQNLATSLFSLRLMNDSSLDMQPPLPLPEVCDLLDSTLKQTRTLTFDISPPVLHDYGLGAALDWLVRRVRERHGLEVSFHAQGSLPCRDESLEANLFRAGQELLNNVVKHASATRAEVSLTCSGSLVSLRVSDNGRGPGDNPIASANPRGFGLFSIRERLRALGGGLEIDSSPGQGCSITLSAPWPQPPAPEAKGSTDEDDHTAGR